MNEPADHGDDPGVHLKLLSYRANKYDLIFSRCSHLFFTASGVESALVGLKMCKLFSVESISRGTVLVDVALVVLAALSLFVFLFVTDHVEAILIRDEFFEVNATQIEKDLFGEKIRNVYFPFLYVCWVIGMIVLAILTYYLRRALKKNSFWGLRIWALLHTIIFCVSLPLSIWWIETSPIFTSDHIMVLVLHMYRFAVVVIVFFYSIVLRFTLENPEPDPFMCVQYNYY